MKNRFKSGIAVISAGIILLFSVASCDDILNTTSETSLSSSSILDTPARIEGLVNGAYKSLKSADLYSGRLLHNNDLRGEEFICLTENALAGAYVWQHNLSSTSNEVNNVWTQAYRVINSTNILISGLSQSDGVISEELKKNYIGEARFCAPWPILPW
jgi:starch-binding outer membrane protein, SusD/RagB family